MVPDETVHFSHSCTFVKIENICGRVILKMCIYLPHPVALWCLVCYTYTILDNSQNYQSLPFSGGAWLYPLGGGLP